MSIFDDRERTRHSGACEGEPPFTYLDTSARPEAIRIRALLNDMASRYPQGARGDLVARIRDNAQHTDAVFELLVHEWCLRAGMRVAAVEPQLEGTANRPDFLIEAPGGRFYLECVVARGESDLDVGARRRVEDVRNALDRVDNPDFLLGIETDGAPSCPVRTTTLIANVEHWLSGLDHAEIRANPNNVPPFEQEIEGLWLRLTPIPRDRTRGERRGRATGLVFDGVREVAPWKAIHRAVLRKATRYGRPNLPYVVALGLMERAARLEHVLDALYGCEAYVDSIERGGRWERQGDGVWHGPRGRQCTRLGAVLVMERAGPWTLGQRGGIFIENLGAERSTAFIDFRIDALRRDANNLRRQTGISLQEVFGLPREWPETPGAATDPC